MADAEGRTQQGHIVPDVKTSAPAADAQGQVVRLAGAGGSSSTVAKTEKDASATTLELLAANTDRKGFSLFNHSSSATLYVAYGVAAVVGEGIEVAPKELYEDPFRFTGAVNGIWSAADGSKTTVYEAE